MTTPIANDLLVIYYTDSTIDSVIVNPSQDDFDNAFASGAAFATIPAGSPSSDIERFAPKPVEPTDDEIRQELEADYLAESESLSKFHAEERDHASFIGSQLRKLFSAGCRIALINPDRPNAEFVVRVSTAHDQLMLQAPIYGGLYSDIYSVMEADEFSLRRYAPATGTNDEVARIKSYLTLAGLASVPVLTVHASKGLEFDAVALACGKRKPSEDSDDARQTFYVAATRAKESLFISSVGEFPAVLKEALTLINTSI